MSASNRNVCTVWPVYSCWPATWSNVSRLQSRSLLNYLSLRIIEFDRLIKWMTRVNLIRKCCALDFVISNEAQHQTQWDHLLRVCFLLLRFQSRSTVFKLTGEKCSMQHSIIHSFIYQQRTLANSPSRNCNKKKTHHKQIKTKLRVLCVCVFMFLLIVNFYLLALKFQIWNFKWNRAQIASTERIWEGGCTKHHPKKKQK